MTDAFGFFPVGSVGSGGAGTVASLITDKTIFVDPAGNDTAAAVGIYDRLRPFATLDAAIAAATAGDTLVLGPGDHAAPSAPVSKNLHWVGAGFATRITGTVTLTTDDVTMTDLRIEGSEAPALVINGTFVGLVARGVYAFGLYTSNPGDAEAIRWESAGAVTYHGGQIRAFNGGADTADDIQAVRYTSAASGDFTRVGGNDQVFSVGAAANAYMVKDVSAGAVETHYSNAQANVVLGAAAVGSDLGLFTCPTGAGRYFHGSSIISEFGVLSGSGERVALAKLGGASLVRLDSASIDSETIARENFYFGDADDVGAEIFCEATQVRASNGEGNMRRPQPTVGTIGPGPVVSYDALIKSNASAALNPATPTQFANWDTAQTEANHPDFVTFATGGITISAHHEGRYRLEFIGELTAANNGVRVVATQFTINGTPINGRRSFQFKADGDIGTGYFSTTTDLIGGDVVDVRFERVSGTADAVSCASGGMSLIVQYLGA